MLQKKTSSNRKSFEKNCSRVQRHFFFLLAPADQITLSRKMSCLLFFVCSKKIFLSNSRMDWLALLFIVFSLLSTFALPLRFFYANQWEKTARKINASASYRKILKNFCSLWLFLPSDNRILNFLCMVDPFLSAKNKKFEVLLRKSKYCSFFTGWKNGWIFYWGNLVLALIIDFLADWGVFRMRNSILTQQETRNRNRGWSENWQFRVFFLLHKKTSAKRFVNYLQTSKMFTLFTK